MFSFFKKKTQEVAPQPAPQSASLPASQPASLQAAQPEQPAQAPAPVESALPPAPAQRSWLSRLKAGLAKTSSNLTTLFIGARIDDDLYEELESALLMSDAGVEATQFLLDALKRKVKDEKLTDAGQVKAALRTLLIELLTPLQKPLELGRYQPLVMMITGVNGAGKTTTIGKLAKHLQAHGQSVLLAAGDTFRAAAREQLAIWGERNNVTVIAQESGDPAAVAFDAIHSAVAKKTDVVMVDTAGRLQTKGGLMDELSKIKRVVEKQAPISEVLLVLDATTGQNGLAQAEAFLEHAGVTGLVLTKLDGSAKGGFVLAVQERTGIPIKLVGQGEGINDLTGFTPHVFAQQLVG